MASKLQPEKRELTSGESSRKRVKIPGEFEKFRDYYMRVLHKVGYAVRINTKPEQFDCIKDIILSQEGIEEEMPYMCDCYCNDKRLHHHAMYIASRALDVESIYESIQEALEVNYVKVSIYAIKDGWHFLNTALQWCTKQNIGCEDRCNFGVTSPIFETVDDARKFREEMKGYFPDLQDAWDFNVMALIRQREDENADKLKDRLEMFKNKAAMKRLCNN
jgi:hypothetical protein